jgi:RNase adapter protein RapZ
VTAARHAQLWVLAGPSGSGRATALAALEGAGVQCTDGLPLGLLRGLAELALSGPVVVTLAIDPGLDGLADAVHDSGAGVVFLDADDRTLVRRLADSTRPHPFASAGPGLAAVSAEREVLGPLRAVADLVVDTTDLSPTELGRRVVAAVRPDGAAAASLTLTVSSFGFKYGPQVEADWIVDVRFLPNPFWVEELRPRTGLDADVAAYVMGTDDGPELVERLRELVTWVASRSEEHGRGRLHIALGCTGGRHRSVAVASALGERLAAQGLSVVVRHRDVERPDPR